MQARSGLHCGSSATRPGGCPPRVVSSRIHASRILPELFLIVLLLFGLSATFQASIAGGSDSAVADEILTVGVLAASGGPATGETMRNVAVELVARDGQVAALLKIWVNGSPVGSREVDANDSLIAFDLNTSEFSTGELTVAAKLLDASGQVLDSDSVTFENPPTSSATIILVTITRE